MAESKGHMRGHMETKKNGNKQHPHTHIKKFSIVKAGFPREGRAVGRHEDAEKGAHWVNSQNISSVEQ